MAPESPGDRPLGAAPCACLGRLPEADTDLRDVANHRFTIQLCGARPADRCLPRAACLMSDSVESRRSALTQDVFRAPAASGAYNHRRLSAVPDASFPTEFAAFQAKSHNAGVGKGSGIAHPKRRCPRAFRSDEDQGCPPRLGPISPAPECERRS